MPAPEQPRLIRVAGRRTWHIRHRGRRVSTGCTDRASAERILARYLTGAEADAPAVDIAAILSRYLADRKAIGKPGVDRLEWAHKPLSAALGHLPPDALTETHSRSYAARRRRNGTAEATIGTELSALRAALRWAHKRGVMRVMPPVLLPPRAEPRDRWLTREESDRLVAACARPHVRLFVLLGLHTGARSGAILSLTWDRVDLERRRIDYRETGGVRSPKRRVPVPVNDTLLAALLEAKEAALSEWVIDWAGQRVASVKHAVARAAARAGLKDVTPHVLRHTAATWMAQAGVPMWEIAGMLGHSSTAMVERVYSHHSPDYLARAAKALG